MIILTETGHSDPFEFEAAVGDGPDVSRHRVTMSLSDLERLARSGAVMREQVRACQNE